MRSRKPLQKQLTAAWQRAIETDYVNQRINSERSLQASFWAQLNHELPAATRRLFVEPRLELKTKGKSQLFYPDLIVCNTREVIAVIELKYQPRVAPSYKKDLNTLATLAKHREQVRVSNSRYRGPVIDDREYPLAGYCLFVWAGVHKAADKRCESGFLVANEEALAGCLLELHAETIASGPPEVVVMMS